MANNEASELVVKLITTCREQRKAARDAMTGTLSDYERGRLQGKREVLTELITALSATGLPRTEKDA